MQVKQIETFKFEELSQEIRKKLIEKNRDSQVEYWEWHHNIYDQFKETATKAGFQVTKIYFSGFWSQGDGAMFEYEGLEEFLKLEFIDSLKLSPMRKEWLKTLSYASGTGKHSGRYSHEKSVNHSICWEVDNGDLHWSTNLHKWVESFEMDFQNFIIEKYEELCGSLYSSLQREYEYLTSDEVIIDVLTSYDHDYTAEGREI
jgi:hypothetical protein